MNIFNGFECSGVNAELKFTAVKFPQIPVFICFPVASTKRCLTEFYQSSSDYPVELLELTIWIYEKGGVKNSDGRTLLGFGLYSAFFNYSYSKSRILS